MNVLYTIFSIGAEYAGLTSRWTLEICLQKEWIKIYLSIESLTFAAFSINAMDFFAILFTNFMTRQKWNEIKRSSNAKSTTYKNWNLPQQLDPTLVPNVHYYANTGYNLDRKNITRAYETDIIHFFAKSSYTTWTKDFRHFLHFITRCQFIEPMSTLNKLLFVVFVYTQKYVKKIFKVSMVLFLCV